MNEDTGIDTKEDSQGSTDSTELGLPFSVSPWAPGSPWLRAPEQEPQEFWTLLISPILQPPRAVQGRGFSERKRQTFSFPILLVLMVVT